MAPKKSRTAVDQKYLPAIAAMETELEEFIARYERIKAYGKPERIAEADEKLNDLMLKKSQLYDQYFAEIAKSDNPELPDLAKADINKNNIGNYD